MTPGLPPPVPLPEPPGDPAALGQVVDRLTSAGFTAGLTVHLLEPAGVLAGWQGADAAVAAAEVGSATAVAADLHAALTAAGSRLADHHQLWLAVAAGVSRLRAEQRAQFAAAGSRLASLVGSGADSDPAGTPPPEALGLVGAVTAEDAARGAEHRRLLAALAEDAGGTAAVLAAAGARFRGPGPGADAAAVTARLAVQLPGWGAGALATLGAQAATELTRPGPAAELDAAVARWSGSASVPGFADGLVAGLGAGGLSWLLSVLGLRAGEGEGRPLAALLAGALGHVGQSPGGRAEEVLAAVRLDPADPDPAVDRVAIGMGLVLAAGAGPALATRWGRQVLAREQARGAPAGAGATGGAALPAPVDAALAVLARSGDPAAAAALLDSAGVWTTLLSRPWPGGTADLAAVVRLAGAAPGAGPAARAALLALGRGLAPGGDGQVLDDAVALGRVRDEVAALVTGQPGVLLPVLDAAAAGVLPDPATGTALRGLGRLVADARSAAAVTAAVREALPGGAAGVSAAALAGAHVAVLEYGQRLRYALSWSAAHSRAVDAQMLWTFAVSGPVAAVRGPAGELAGVLEDVLADALDANGEVEIGPDTGRVRTGEDAVRFAADTLGRAPLQSESAASGEGFRRAGEVLGRLTPPQESPLERLDDVPLPDRSRWGRRGG